MKAQIWNHCAWVLETDPAELRARFAELLDAATFSIVGFTETHFEPHGYTAVWILAESHFALHTFPEAQRTYCQVSSCNWPKFVRLVELIEPMQIA